VVNYRECDSYFNRYNNERTGYYLLNKKRVRQIGGHVFIRKEKRFAWLHRQLLLRLPHHMYSLFL
jgi:hypothetical protein